MTLQQRFEEKYTPEPNSGCWLWTAGCFPAGYGAISGKIRSRPMCAHRVSWELYRGPIPEGMHILHKCDVRSCVNPDHLFVGTHQDNMKDMARKGRNNKKVTVKDRLTIARSTEHSMVAAKRFGVSQRYVNMLRKERIAHD